MHRQEGFAGELYTVVVATYWELRLLEADEDVGIPQLTSFCGEIYVECIQTQSVNMTFWPYFIILS